MPAEPDNPVIGITNSGQVIRQSDVATRTVMLLGQSNAKHVFDSTAFLLESDHLDNQPIIWHRGEADALPTYVTPIAQIHDETVYEADYAAFEARIMACYEEARQAALRQAPPEPEPTVLETPTRSLLRRPTEETSE